MNKYDQFLKVCYSGRTLLENHTLDEYGIWQVYGEDPNCDFGGHHHQPELGVYEGILRDVVALAVELPGFWQWGSGGDILKRNISKIDRTTIQVRNKKREELKELEAKVAALKKELCL